MTIPQHKYDEFSKDIKSGDILLCSGNAVFSKLIQKATGSPWSHVGFILHLQDIDRLIILESVESIGVRAVPLNYYIHNYNGSGKPYPGKILIARHQDTYYKDMRVLSRRAVDLLGFPYDKEEILKIAGRLFANTKSDFLDGKPTSYICSEYADECYQSIGIHIKHGKKDFITPADFFNDPNVRPLSYINFS